MNIFINFYTTFIETLQGLRRSQLWQLMAVLLLLILIGTVSYSVIEGWNVLDALYATVITITTIGYGDLTPITPAGRIFATGFSIVAISFGGYAISAFAVYTIESSRAKRIRKFRKKTMKQISEFRNHYILCGATMITKRIAEEFNMRDVDFLIIADDEEKLKFVLLFAHPEYFAQKVGAIINFEDADLSDYEDLDLIQISEMVGIPFILQDPTDDMALIKAGIEHAEGLIAAAGDDRDNLSIVIGARNLAKRAGNDDLRIMAHVTEVAYMRKILLAGADGIRNGSMTSGQEMATHIMYPVLGDWWNQRTNVMTGQQGMFDEITIDASHKWHGMTVSDIHKNYGTVIASLKRDGAYLSPPAHDLSISQGDVLIVIHRDG